MKTIKVTCSNAGRRARLGTIYEWAEAELSSGVRLPIPGDCQPLSFIAFLVGDEADGFEAGKEYEITIQEVKS